MGFKNRGSLFRYFISITLFLRRSSQPYERLSIVQSVVSSWSLRMEPKIASKSMLSGKRHNDLKGNCVAMRNHRFFTLMEPWQSSRVDRIDFRPSTPLNPVESFNEKMNRSVLFGSCDFSLGSALGVCAVHCFFENSWRKACQHPATTATVSLIGNHLVHISHHV